jgi:Fe-S oxidoreductase
MRRSGDVTKMRAIAEEACAMVQEYKGSFSGEHGDGLVRTEWIEPIYGPKLARAFEAIKDAFDPKGLLNPGKIVRGSKMDARELFRFKPGYATEPLVTALDWSEHEVGAENKGRGFAAAIEMCNNNGHCRKFDAGTMCPSYRVTRDERHLTRGRANALRLALSGQLGRAALTSPEMFATMELCVSCKGCRRECPTGVDMARMKIEFLYHYHRRHPRSLKDRLVAHLPRYAERLLPYAWLLNLRDRIPGLPILTEWLLGFAAKRSLPVWRRDVFGDHAELAGGAVAGRADAAEEVGAKRRELVLLADTFNRYFAPEILRAAVRVLEHAGYRIHFAQAEDQRPLCCGRTYLASGMVDEARAEAARLVAALAPFVARGVPVVGLEPACLLGLRDEFAVLLPGQSTAELARLSFTFEEFVRRETVAGRMNIDFKPTRFRRALVHGHCHQKAFGLMPALQGVLDLIPGLAVEQIQSSCCGMAGSFGYSARNIDVSLRMAEQDLLPAVRAADEETVIVADGTSCRHQILDGSKRPALHTVELLAQALPTDFAAADR